MLGREKPMGSGASLNCRSRDGQATVDLHPKQGGTSIQVPDGTALRLRGERDGSWLVEYMGREYFVKTRPSTTKAYTRMLFRPDEVRARTLRWDSLERMQQTDLLCVLQAAMLNE